MCRRVSESWGRELEAIGLREKVCFRVLFESLPTEGAQRMLGGSWFHRVGADTHKALSPKVLSLARGIASWSLSEDLRDLRGV